MAEPQTAIILVTDLVGSTAQRSEIGEDAAEELRRRHDALLKEAVTAHEGVVVKNLGDGVLARFAGAASAVASAVDVLQRADGRFEIRVGISAGDVTLEDGDCFGTPVIEASRLCDRADGGQVLVAELVRLLARGRGGHVFELVGDLDLKGLPDPVSASEVVWERVPRGGIRFPAALRSAGLPFVGRVSALEEVTLAWKSIAGGDRSVVLVSGEPGMGKTRLASELSAVARNDGGTVLFGRCDDEVTSVHRPFTEALTPLVADLPADVIGTHVERFGGALVGLVPEIASRVPGMAVLEGGSGDQRLVVYDAVADLLGRASQLAPVLLVLDDLHWADDGSVLLLRHLARSPDLGAVSVVGTYRDSDLDRGHRLRSALADLNRVPGVKRVALEGLDLDEVVALMASVGGYELDERGLELARIVHGKTEGNPFFIGELLQHLAESGAIYESDGRWVSDAESMTDIGVPRGIREVVGRRLDSLPEETNATLRAAAVIGQEFDLRVLAGALERGVDDLIDDLDPALDRNIVVEVPGGIDQLRFPHALVRQTLYEELSTSRRTRLHARIASAWGALDGDHPTERAHHLLEAAAVSDLDQVVGAAIEAAHHERRSLEWEAVVDWIDRALEVVTDATADRADLEADLFLERAEELLVGGELAEGTDAAQRAAEIARDHNLNRQLVAATVMLGLAGGWHGLDTTGALALVAEAEETLAPHESVERAELMVARAHLSIGSTDPADSIDAALEGLAMVRRTGSSRLFEALLTALDNLRGEPDPDLILELALEMKALGPGRSQRSLYFEALAHLKRGRFDQVAKLAEEMHAESARRRDRHLEWEAHLIDTNLHLRHAQWDDAWASLARAESIDDGLGETGLGERALKRLQIGVLRNDGELVGEALTLLQETAPLWGALFPREAVVGEILGTSTAEELHGSADEWFDTIWPLLPHWLRAFLLGWLSPLLRHASPLHLTPAIEFLGAHTGLWLTGATGFHYGHVSGSLARYRAAQDDLDAAIILLDEAIIEHDRASEVPLRTQFATDTVEVLSRRSGPGDRDRARRLADEVAEACDRFGIDRLSNRVTNALA